MRRITGMLIVAGLCVGCSSSGSDASTATATTVAAVAAAATADPPRPISVAPLAQTGKPVPEPLQTIEEQAEDIGDIVPAGKWDGVAADNARITEAWKQLASIVEADGAPSSLTEQVQTAIDSLTGATEAKDAAAVAQAANDLTRPIVELFGMYEVGRPMQIGRLDVVGRQIVLDAERNDAPGVAAQLAQARVEWSAITADISANQGADVMAQTEQSFSTMERALSSGDFPGVVAEGRNFLEIVDAMERLY